MKKLVFYINIICALSIFLLSIQSCNNRKNLDWTPSFDSEHKTPLGTYVLREELQSLFPNSDITDIPIHLANYLEDNASLKNTNLIFIESYSSSDRRTTEAIEVYVDSGNIAFLGVRNYSSFNHLFDKASLNDIPMDTIAGLNKVDTFYLNDNLFKNKTYLSYGSTKRTYFIDIPNRAEVLGYIKINGKKEINFFRISKGKGWLYFHANPYIFTNYGILNGKNEKYVEDVFSHLPDQDILWNNKNIQGRTYSYNYDYDSSRDQWAFIKKNPSLYTAFLILLFGGLLYLAFNSRRRQAAVAYHKPYKNDYLDYSSSLQKVYKNTRNYKYLTTVKISYFLHQVKDHYYITNIQFDDQFAHQLHIKSEVSSTECFQLVQYMNQLNALGYVNENSFILLSDMLDKFYTQTKIYGK